MPLLISILLGAMFTVFISCQPFKSRTIENLKVNNAGSLRKGLQYLLFQTGGGSFPTDVAGGTARVSTRAQAEKEIDDLIAALGGNRGNHVNTQLGFTTGPYSFDMTDDQVRTLIKDSFDLAETKNIAVAFHIDDSMFWNRREDLWSKKENIEWTDWEGTTKPRRVIGWAKNAEGESFLAPQMCYNSTEIVNEAKRVAKDVIGAEIKKGMDRLRAIGKPHLFAGVMAGWETRLQDDSQNPHNEYGYCALTNLGFTRDNPPADKNKEFEGVVLTWVTLWTKSLYDAGIPRDKIFTHIAYDSNADAQEVNAVNAPVSVAFTPYSNPGYSMYGNSYPDTVAKALAENGNPPWGISEGTALSLTDAFNGGTSDKTVMEGYLAGAFNHGAAYVNVFGVNFANPELDEFAKSSTGVEAIAAYKKFLNQEPLKEVPYVSENVDIGKQLQDVLKQMQDAIKAAQAEGKNLSFLDDASKELTELLEGGKAKEAIDKAKEIIAQIEAA